MKRCVFELALVALCLVALLLPPTASAGEVFHFKGRSAFAFFHFSPDPACGNVLEAHLFAFEDRSQDLAGPPTTLSSAFLTLSKYDTCTNTLLVSASGNVLLGTQDFKVTGNPGKASLKTTIQVYDWVSASSFTVFVDLTWGNPGTISRDTNHLLVHTPDFTLNVHSMEAFRYAGATGVISDGATNYTAGFESLAAWIAIIKSGSVEVSH